ncbi:ubiquinol-cytochrome c reductase [Marivirga lumbricoides]|uniref:EVE domain-containing protein n=1 Tax=Marivirga lumbricoides TaxID=1046115 RepID=A0A2T4DVZ0_9BACT|nr:EVE domain-containing protein [Marivirga lumbricoides]GGC46056.1 ubiquinol-cytochrome c reductase [Marivirga lumbricoides]
MNYWLVKQEPEKYSFDDLLKDKKTMWDGVRNYQARNNLREMKNGDLVLFYHSVKQKEVVGICEVIKEHFPDPTTDDNRWVAIDIQAKHKLSQPVSLEQIKGDDRLQNIALIKQSRLSVLPLKKEEFDVILELSE